MTNSQDDTQSMNSEEDLYYFESDHLALRGNKDYNDVLKTVLVLCAQRAKAIKDYSKVVQLKKEALEDPAKILEKIIKGDSLGVPEIHSIPELPSINWSQYNVKIPEEYMNIINSEENGPKKKKEPSPKKDKISHGRWTPEEQKRLEELLQIYPPEPIEMRRFKKIADALGNRTIHQVSSRLQKYFLKLYKAGLPIPGRIPKSVEKYRKNSLHRHQRHNHYLWKPTTFFPDLIVPVFMNDADSAPGPSLMPEDIAQPSTSSNYLMPSAPYDETPHPPVDKTENEMKMDLLRRIRREMAIAETEPNLFKHHGFKCDECEEEPIIGARWHCVTCQPDSVDFCTDCAFAQFVERNGHPLHHHIVEYGAQEADNSSDSGSGGVKKRRACSNSSSDSDGSMEEEEDTPRDDIKEILDRQEEELLKTFDFSSNAQ